MVEQIRKGEGKEHVNQCVLYILKQVNDHSLKEKIIDFLSTKENGKGSALIAKFGEKEFSLLSALGSQNKISKENAIKTVNKPEFFSKISERERDLVRLQLQNLILNGKENTETVVQLLDCLDKMTVAGKESNEEFDTLEQFIDANIKGLSYPREVIEKAIQMAGKLTVGTDNR